MAELSDCLTMFEEVLDKVAAAVTKKKLSGHSSEDDTHLNKSPDSELHSVINVVQRGQSLRKA